MHLCRIALISLLLQSRLPDKINLWVSKKPHLKDLGISDRKSVHQLIDTLPSHAQSLVCVRWVENLGPYRKLIPILRESNPEDILITADDDIFYGRNWLKGLMDVYDRGGGRAVAVRVRRKKRNFLRKYTSYIFWDIIKESSVINDDFIITFGGGAVLKRSMFSEKDISDDSFFKVAPTADDLWYSKIFMLNKNEVIVAPSLLSELNFIQHSDGLTKFNYPNAISIIHRIAMRFWNKSAGFLGVPVCGNDIALKRIEQYFSKRTVKKSQMP